MLWTTVSVADFDRREMNIARVCTDGIAVTDQSNQTSMSLWNSQLNATKKAGQLWLNHFSRLLSVQRLFTAWLDPTITQNDVGLTHVEWSIIPFVFLNSDFALRVNCSPKSESLHILCDESNVFGVRRFITRINTALSLQLGFTVLPNRSRFMYDRESENASGVQAATCLTIMTTIKLRIDS